MGQRGQPTESASGTLWPAKATDRCHHHEAVALGSDQILDGHLTPPRNYTQAY